MGAWHKGKMIYKTAKGYEVDGKVYPSLTSATDSIK